MILAERPENEYALLCEMGHYGFTAAAFLWLTWRCMWATAPDPHAVAGRGDARPVLFWLDKVFYCGMASFEIASNLGL